MTIEKPLMDKQANTQSVAQAIFAAFAISLATILLQLVQTRIFSVVYWNHLVYFIISIALLGFGISGTLLTFNRLSSLLSLRNASILFAVTAIFSSLIMPRLGLSLTGFFTKSEQVSLIITYASAVLPYFFGGWMLGSLFRDHASRMNLLYFSDLIGAALGCVVFTALMQPLGAVNLILICCAAVLLSGLILGPKDKLRTFWAVAALILFVGGYIQSDSLGQAITPEPTKGFMANWSNLEPGDKKIVEFSEWNSISRIDVVSSLKKSNLKELFIDGDAWTEIVVNPPDPPTPWDPIKDNMVCSMLAYMLHTNYENSLVIGSGGGIDVWNALRAGARNVDAVEINPTTTRLGLQEYRDINNNLFSRPGVNVFNEEGRSFVRRSSRQYDVIMMKGIDTFAAINAGAYVLSENFLYTVDAVKDYLQHLKPNGTLCIHRWRDPAESARLFVIALEALHELGVENPNACIIVPTSGNKTAVMVRKTPFSEEEIRRMYEQQARYPKVAVLYPTLAGGYWPEEGSFFIDYANLRQEGRQNELLDTLPYDVSPVWDDSPFFFHTDRLSQFAGVIHSVTNASELIRGHWASFTLLALLAFTLLAVILFMGVPLMVSGGRNMLGFWRWLLYFSCLGVGFIFVEIALMQRFALLLGHPSRSLTLVLGALLFSAGVGSWLSGLRRMPVPLLMGGVVLGILAAAFLYPTLILTALPYPLLVRGLCTVALVAPLGILMGMPFPTGIRQVSKYGEKSVPWMWGVNGGTTVLGSILAILIAIQTSFTTVLVSAAIAYAIAAVIAATLLTGRKI